MNKIQIYFKDSAGKKICLAAFIVFVGLILGAFALQGKRIKIHLICAYLFYLMAFYQSVYFFFLYKYSRGLDVLYEELMNKIGHKIRLSKWLSVITGLALAFFYVLSKIN